MQTIEYSIKLTPSEIEQFHVHGYHIQRNVFNLDQVVTLKAYFDDLAEKGVPAPDNHWVPDLNPENFKKDPLARYPRVMMPHRFNDQSRKMMLELKIRDLLWQFFNEEPLSAQSMFYFKPPGSRGQALHQDNFYLSVKPGTCIAAWTAIDPATPENGGLYVVPNTGDLAITCPEKADEAESFVSHFVKPPPGKKAIPVHLQPGDTLFFNGNVIHGSGPNRHATQWRRAFICHYIPRTTQFASKYYKPFVTFEDEEVAIAESTDGGPCGTEWGAKDPYGA
ncbi:MAG: phytanoyl-CoA dioxygenase family protein [Verrucomicrobiota bacterium]|nr:phytanoyl-CoA dioxygenase family protein [Verrucomicrobiota bacterium]